MRPERRVSPRRDVFFRTYPSEVVTASALHGGALCTGGFPLPLPRPPQTMNTAGSMGTPHTIHGRISSRTTTDRWVGSRGLVVWVVEA